MPKELHFFDEHEKELFREYPLHINSIFNVEDGIVVRIFHKDEEPFEPYSDQVITIPLYELIRGACNWHSSMNSYSDILRAYKQIAYHLKYLADCLELDGETYQLEKLNEDEKNEKNL